MIYLKQRRKLGQPVITIHPACQMGRKGSARKRNAFKGINLIHLLNRNIQGKGKPSFCYFLACACLTFSAIIIITLYFKKSTDSNSSGSCCALPVWTPETDELKIIDSLEKHTLYDISLQTFIVIV